MSVCPHCKKDFQHVNLKTIKAVQASAKWHALSYDCPHCHCSLSVGIDITMVKEEIIGALRNPSR